MKFDPNDRAAILAALKDPNPANPIAQAIAKRLEELTTRYKAHAEKLGRVPTELMLIRPKTEFDDVVYRLHLQAIADNVGQKLTIVWVDSEPSS